MSQTYNQAERLGNVSIAEKQVAAYTYDAFGHRFSKTTAGGQSLFQYDAAGNLIEETDGTGAVKTDTIYLNGQPIADITPVNGATFFLHTGRLGTPLLATTTLQAVAWKASYRPFGTNAGASGLFTQNLRFAGQYADAETGWYQNGFRDYNPGTGRYLESDPIGLAGGANTFAYASASPLRGIDPLGLDCSGATSFQQFISALDNVNRTLEAPINWGIQQLSDFINENGLQYTPFVELGIFGEIGAAAEGAGAAEQGGLNLFKWEADTTTNPAGWRDGDFMLNLPDQGSAAANWAQNSGALREQMGLGQPIYDSYRDPVTGLQIPTRGFLNAERYLLESRGWQYSPATGAYHPPAP